MLQQQQLSPTPSPQSGFGIESILSTCADNFRADEGFLPVSPASSTSLYTLTRVSNPIFLPNTHMNNFSLCPPLFSRSLPEPVSVASPKRAGHPYQSRQHPVHKKPRTSFTKAQVAILETRFKDQKYLASMERAVLASQLEMSDAQVKTWFQNRRTKWRRQEAEARDYSAKTVARILANYRQQISADEQLVVCRQN